MRILTPIVFIAVWFIWLMYHWLIKKDLAAHRHTVGLGIFFSVLWLLIWWWLGSLG